MASLLRTSWCVLLIAAALLIAVMLAGCDEITPEQVARQHKQRNDMEHKRDLVDKTKYCVWMGGDRIWMAHYVCCAKLIASSGHADLKDCDHNVKEIRRAANIEVNE